MKKSLTVTYTHKGWLGLCPCYFAALDTDCPHVLERHWSLAWLLDMSNFITDTMGMLATLVNADAHVPFVLRVTGRLNPPKTITHEYEE